MAAAGRPGALAGGAAFILPGLVVILALSALFLSGSPPRWVIAAGAGAGAAVAAVAVQAGAGLLPASWRGARSAGGGRPPRWIAYLAAGIAAAATLGPWLVVVLLACGVIEIAVRHPAAPARVPALVPLSLAASGDPGGRDGPVRRAGAAGQHVLPPVPGQ